jgi:hypothetical protein
MAAGAAAVNPIMRRTLVLSATALSVGCGTDVSGPASSLYSCVFLDPASVGVGEAIPFEGAGNRSLCLTPSDGDAAFVYIPFYSAPSDPDQPDLTIGVEVLGAGLTAPPSSGAPGGFADALILADPSGATRPAPPLRRDVEAHRLLREREIAELGPKIRAGVSAEPLPAGTGRPAPEVGDFVDYNVAASCNTADMRTGQVTYVSTHAIVVADIQNPDGLGAQDYEHFAVSFDTLVEPVSVRHFGTPTDIDGNGRTIIFFTRSVNERTPRGSATYTAALFWAGDLFPATGTPRLDACPQGNRAEIFYMAVPDPNGVIGPVIRLADLREGGIGILGHEYQHLINAARRMYVNDAPAFEETWLNEGLSHIAEELLFFEVSGLPRRSNLTEADLQETTGGVTAFNRYMAPNLGNLGRYLERPDTASLMGRDQLTTRGAAWSFLRYAADRREIGDETFFFELVNSTAVGLDNLDRAVAGSAADWIQDWTVALIADDDVPGLDPRFTQPSWNFRDLYVALERPYPLNPPALAAGTPRSLSLRAGGVGYLAFGVAADGRAALHVESDGAAPPRSLRGTFLRVR